jgi:CheY-like chemotaxis protein
VNVGGDAELVVRAIPEIDRRSRRSGSDFRSRRCDHPTMAATVLVVDDHPSFRRFARRLLESAGYRVVDEAGDGAEALAAVRSLRPEIVLLDVLLPDTTGPELANVLADEPGAPVVVLTSSRSASDLGQSLASSSTHGFISKRELTAATFAALVGNAT